MGPQDPKDVTRDMARDLTRIAGELGALKADTRWLKGPEYEALRHRLEAAHAAAEAAVVEARRRVRLDEGRWGKHEAVRESVVEPGVAVRREMGPAWSRNLGTSGTFAKVVPARREPWANRGYWTVWCWSGRRFSWRGFA